MSRTFLIACLDGRVRTAIGDEAVRVLLDRLDTARGRWVRGDEREDPETGGLLPPGVDGFPVGGRPR